ncbi:hypothetical protein PR202_gb06504 [Eleusine coracana subsp. coracana]|uniref:Uncharacterized protein n=1 Tax=Eleusine coracana subsp. coracana TaxID=191504 RepID=A0AAV5E9K3_ELECO|nr:hypothetical protein QOZ80_2BG0158150 [Eleusine coracana subsp. coracana]GJN19252.1 hypothetical protein PR202_gb06504 [Eleusine coracana subsp. coracana]
MGLKLSCISRGSLSRQASLTAAPVRVITVDGSLKEFPASPLAAVTNALGLGSGDAAAAPSSFFVCNSDALYFNESPPALAPGDLLRPGQIYFVLPAAMLGRPLSSTEMAELAVRASAALAASSNKARRRCGRRHGRNGGKKQKVRVMPVRVDQENGGDDMFINQKLNEHTLGEFGLTMSPARSGEKKVSAARSRLRRALSIIREDAE